MAEMSMQECIEKGNTLVLTSMQNEWKELVENDWSKYSFLPLLEVMEAVKEGRSFEELYDQIQSTFNPGFVVRVVNQMMGREDIFNQFQAKRKEEFDKEWSLDATPNVEKEEPREVKMDKSRAKEIKPENRIEATLDKLRVANQFGENVYCEVSTGVYSGILYSADAITNDALYQQVFGKTKYEVTKENLDRETRMKSESERKDEEARAKIPELIEQGKGLIPEGKLERWKEIVNISANGPYRGLEVEGALNVMHLVQAGEISEIKKGDGWPYIRLIVAEMMGQEVVENIECKEIKISKIDKKPNVTPLNEPGALIKSGVEATEEKTTFDKMKEMATKVLEYVKGMFKSKDDRNQGEDR